MVPETELVILWTLFPMALESRDANPQFSGKNTKVRTDPVTKRPKLKCDFFFPTISSSCCLEVSSCSVGDWQILSDGGNTDWSLNCPLEENSQKSLLLCHC